MGLQFENLVLNNLSAIIGALGLKGKIVISAAPFRCMRSARGGGLQVDLLVQTDNTAWVVEIKRRGELGIEVAGEIGRKVDRLAVRRGVSIRTALIYDGKITRALEASDKIDRLIAAKELLLDVNATSTKNIAIP